MKDYTSSNPEFKAVIKVVEPTDPAHADNINASVKQLLQNTMANRADIADAVIIAKGRCTGYVFDTYDDLTAWVSEPENTADLNLGDNLYIRALDVSDYWWDGNIIQPLETQKVDLSELEPLILSGTLATGATTLTFTNAAITDDCMIDIYTNKADVMPSTATQSGNTLTLTFDAQTVAIGVKVRVM